MKIQIKKTGNYLELRGDLPQSNILSLSRKGITLYGGVNQESSLCLTEEGVEGQIEVEEESQLTPGHPCP